MASRPVAMGASWSRCFHRQVAAQGNARDFDHDRKNKDGERDHEYGDLGVRLGRQIGGHGGGDAGHQGRCAAADNQSGRGDGDTLETFPLGGRRLLHGIDVKPCRLRWRHVATRIRFQFVSI